MFLIILSWPVTINIQTIILSSQTHVHTIHPHLFSHCSHTSTRKKEGLQTEGNKRAGKSKESTIENIPPQSLPRKETENCSV